MRVTYSLHLPLVVVLGCLVVDVVFGLVMESMELVVVLLVELDCKT